MQALAREKVLRELFFVVSFAFEFCRQIAQAFLLFSNCHQTMKKYLVLKEEFKDHLNNEVRCGCLVLVVFCVPVPCFVVRSP